MDSKEIARRMIREHEDFLIEQYEKDCKFIDDMQDDWRDETLQKGGNLNMAHLVSIVIHPGSPSHGHPDVLKGALKEIATQLARAIDEVEELYGQDCWSARPHQAIAQGIAEDLVAHVASNMA